MHSPEPLTTIGGGASELSGIQPGTDGSQKYGSGQSWHTGKRRLRLFYGLLVIPKFSLDWLDLLTGPWNSAKTFCPIPIVSKMFRSRKSASITDCGRRSSLPLAFIPFPSLYFSRCCHWLTVIGRCSRRRRGSGSCGRWCGRGDCNLPQDCWMKTELLHTLDPCPLTYLSNKREQPFASFSRKFNKNSCFWRELVGDNSLSDLMYFRVLLSPEGKPSAEKQQ